MTATRFYILKDDRTTKGGRVIGGLESCTWHGRPTAWEGDPIDCPACHSVGFIQCVGTRVSATDPSGRQQALDGDLCMCRCTPPPRLIASQSVFFTHGHVDSQTFLAVDAAERPNPVFDIYFLVQDPHSNAVLAYTPYRITLDNGEVFEGVTNDEGCTARVSSNTSQHATIEVPFHGDIQTASDTHNQSDTCRC